MQVYVAPSGWGTFGSSATRLDAAAALTSVEGTGSAYSAGSGPGLHLSSLRLGGSMILADGYRWKRFRGAASDRQPYKGFWYAYTSAG